jgi:diguanylate cyclase (GGDEF)-like protein
MKILIAEDEAVSRMTLQRALRTWGHEVVNVENGADPWTVLQEADAPQIALVDWMMPGLDGVELCRRLRKGEQGPYVYVILIIARNQREELLESLEEGADDFLTKPWEPDELRARLNVGQRIVRLQQDLVHSQDALYFQATHDSLTGLNNRRDILAVLQREMSRCTRQNTSLGIVLADIDHFKQINDEHGHQAGDSVLQEVARRLLATVRAYDAVGLYGGEEFLIVVPSADALGVVVQAERIRNAFDKRSFGVGTNHLDVKLSTGVAVADSLSSPDPASLLRAADAALYRAKKNTGRNRMELATSSEPNGNFPAPAWRAAPQGPPSA